MASNKKSVLLYCDLIHTIEKMDDETAGLFFKHYLRYVNDLSPKTDNIVVDLTFESVKQNLKRDLKKWEERANNSRKNGALGGRPKKNPKGKNKTQKTHGVISEPKKPVNVNVTVTDTVNVNEINVKGGKAFKNESEFLNFFNNGRKALLGKKGKTKVMGSTDSNNFKKLNPIYTVEEFKHAITMMSKDEWVIKASKFTISHLLAPVNFDKYLNKVETLPQAQGLIEGN